MFLLALQKAFYENDEARTSRALRVNGSSKEIIGDFPCGALASGDGDDIRRPCDLLPSPSVSYGLVPHYQSQLNFYMTAAASSSGGSEIGTVGTSSVSAADKGFSSSFVSSCSRYLKTNAVPHSDRSGLVDVLRVIERDLPRERHRQSLSADGIKTHGPPRGNR